MTKFNQVSWILRIELLFCCLPEQLELAQLILLYFSELEVPHL